MEAIDDYWDGYLEMPPRTLGDTLILCDELAPVTSPLHKLGSRKPGDGIKASIDLAIGEETLTGILEESAEEVRSLTAALRF